MKDYQTIQVETIERVGLVRLHRPRSLNSLSPQLMEELIDALFSLDHDQAIGAMVITGSKRSFAAGADIKSMAEASTPEIMNSDFILAFASLQEVKKPLIAAVSGYCLGGGNELALACDLIIASQTARFGQPEIKLGIIPGAGGTQRLTRAVGKALSMEMILNDRTLSAEEALHHGLVNYVFPEEEYLDEALGLAQEIAQRAPVAVQAAKEMINQAFETPLTEGLRDERQSFYLLFSTQDQQEGMNAFLEKRTPNWKGK